MITLKVKLTLRLQGNWQLAFSDWIELFNLGLSTTDGGRPPFLCGLVQMGHLVGREDKERGCTSHDGSHQKVLKALTEAQYTNQIPIPSLPMLSLLACTPLSGAHRIGGS